MGFNFPNSPAVGDKYPATGTPLYQWDGSVWNSIVGGPGGGGASIIVSDTPPSGAPDNALWWESDSGTLYLRYNDGDSTQWVVVSPPSAPTTGVVRYDSPQTMTSAQQAQARSNMYAAPFDALASSGIQINGSMDVSQELGTTVRTTNGYACDGWILSYGGTMALSAAQVADAPPGYSNSIKITVTTPSASLGAGDVAGFIQLIEGYRTSRLAFGTASAQPISIGFWTKIHRPGMYSGAIRNNATTRSYVFSFTQNAADTWEYKTVTIPGDTLGTWLNTNGAGISLCFTLASGTTYQSAGGAWVAANLIGVTGTTNGVAAATDTFQITGVVVLPGVELPSAARAPLIMRPYDQELRLCRRYWESRLEYLNLSASSGSLTIGISISYVSSKRAVPTLSLRGSPAYANCSGLTLSNSDMDQFLPYVTSSAAGGVATNFTWIADARL